MGGKEICLLHLLFGLVIMPILVKLKYVPQLVVLMVLITYLQLWVIAPLIQILCIIKALLIYLIHIKKTIVMVNDVITEGVY